MKTCLAIMAGVMSLAAGSASAHHSFSVFDMQEEISITGTVKEVQWTNPHIWIWVDVPNEDGEIVTWGLEGMSPNFLARRGWTRNTLKTGDKVTVSLRPLKSGEPGGMFMQTTAPDGTILSMGGGREGDNN
jgi:Cu/Ag efflux protein CusF